MFLSTISLVAALSGVANAHFRLLYPAPRGEFVADLEPKFCGGYNDAVNNRSQFPLSGGFISLKTGHPGFTAGVLISTVQNPNSFDNFSVNGQQQFVRPFANEAAAGTFCIPLNMSDSNIAGVRDGANVTIQVVLGGSDGNLYQCADLTLSQNYTIPSNTSCQNVTTAQASSSGAHGPSGTSQPTGGSLGQAQMVSGYVIAGLGMVSLLL
ncbi:hypothetical protein BD779DRAFT_1666222 [Infundibulicybe gibba]|nr:hypothetical protein BD779DRAFT_1666222 [Infundibulicybe gibba]